MASPSRPVELEQKSQLLEPFLFVSGLNPAVTDAELAGALRDCLRMRPSIDRDAVDTSGQVSGKIEFESIDRAEKSYATVNDYSFKQHSGTMRLSIHQNPADDLIPTTAPLLVKSLPPTMTTAQVFDLFRVLGPIYRVSGGTAGQAVIRFYEEEDSLRAVEEMHISEIEGNTISVRVQESRTRGREAGDGEATIGLGIPTSIMQGTTSTEIVCARSTSDTSQISMHSGWTASTSSPRPLFVNSSLSTAASSPEISVVTGTKKDGLDTPTKGMAALHVGEEDSEAEQNDLQSMQRPVSATAGLTERERLILAVSRIENRRTEEIVDLLQGLERKERALCLFNPAYLETKVVEALEVLDSLEDDPLSPSATSPSKRPPSTPSPTSSDLSNAAFAKSILVPSTLEELCALPAIHIIHLINSYSTDLLGIIRVGRGEELEMDRFVDSLEGSSVQLRKQALGEKLFKEIKSFGIKGAPRLTISLLDSEDLRSLAHLINYPTILKEKVLAIP